MRYYACNQELWQEKLQENSSYTKQVFSDFKIDKIAPKFHEAILQICS